MLIRDPLLLKQGNPACNSTADFFLDSFSISSGESMQFDREESDQKDAGFLYVYSGSGTIYVNNCAIPIAMDCIFSPGRERSFKINGKVDLVLYWVRYSEVFLTQAVSSHLETIPFGANWKVYHSEEFYPGAVQEIREIIYKMEKHSSELLPLSGLILAHYLHLLILLAGSIDKNVRVKGPVEIDRITELKTLIDEQFRTVHSPCKYALQLRITPDYLNKLVRDKYDKTTSELIMERRMLEARRLLAYSGKSCKEISHYLGFDGPSHFGRIFKQNCQTSPGAFRRNVRLSGRMSRFAKFTPPGNSD